MLESRLILKVTVLAPKLHDHIANGHAVKDRVVGPQPLTLLSGGVQGRARLAVVLWGKHNFILVARFDEGCPEALPSVRHTPLSRVSQRFCSYPAVLLPFCWRAGRCARQPMTSGM